MAEENKPSVKDQSLTGKVPERILEFFSKTRDKITQNDIDSITGWKDKMRVARNMRYGIKRATDYPYQGAPDIPLPETDKIIRKHKPRFVLAVTSGKKYMKVTPQEGAQEVTPEMKESAKKANLAMNYMFRMPKMDWLRKLTYSADRFLEKGQCVFKIVDRYESRIVNKIVDVNEFSKEEIQAVRDLDKESKREFIANRFGLDPDNIMDSKTLNKIISEFMKGKKIIKFKTEEVTSLPNVLIPTPERVYVPPETTCIDDAQRITNEFYWSEQTLVDLALNNTLIKDKVLKIIKDNKDSGLKKGDPELNERVKDRMEGVEDTDRSSEMYRMHETICWYQPKDDARYEKWLFVYFADLGSPEDALVQFMPFPYEFDGWNYVKHDNEVMDERYRSSRGIPEQIRAIQEFMEKSMNNMLIRDEINNAPMFTVKNASNIVSDTVKFIPGQSIEVNDHDDIRQLNPNPTGDTASQQILHYLKSSAEEYVGISDQLFKNGANTGGSKTLGEIQIGVTEAQFAVNLDILNWVETIRKVYEKAFFVARERLTNPLIINGTTITREDFQFIPDIVVNGSLEMADKALQQQRAQLRLERARQAKQDGVATGDDVFRAYEDFFEKDGVKEPTDFITDAKDVAKEVITQLENKIRQLQEIMQDQQSEIAQQDNTLRQINQQISRKGGGSETDRTKGADQQPKGPR